MNARRRPDAVVYEIHTNWVSAGVRAERARWGCAVGWLGHYATAASARTDGVDFAITSCPGVCVGEASGDTHE